MVCSEELGKFGKRDFLIGANNVYRRLYEGEGCIE